LAVALKRVLTLTTLCLLAVLSGCWGGSGDSVEPEPEAKELKTSSDALSTEVPEADLVRLAKKLYQVGMYSVARDSFSSLKDRYPLGAYSTFAELKVADTFFYNHEYNEAAKSYESFLKSYPGSSESPYAKLQAARSHVASAKGGGGRDRQPLERGLALYDEIVSEYPGTAYSSVAQHERAPAIVELAAYDKEIIRFYEKRGNELAVQDREKKFKDRWASRLGSSSLESQPETAHSSGQALMALTQVSPPPPIPQARVSSTMTETSGSSAHDDSPTFLAEGRIVVQSVKCEGDDVRFGVIEVSETPKSLAGADVTPRILNPTAGKIILEQLGLAARQDTFNCFGVSDLSISPSGDLVIATEKAISVTTLEEPSRILLAPAS
jgi:outer membrane assembly lipoprotein YfiO